ncbi:MAG: MFS transporter [Phycisphaerales bacterium]|nr:MFS transporter [Phycisphaerales bacterium]
MSTISSSTDPKHSSTDGARWRASTTVGTHFVVDVFSFVGISLLPMLVVQLGLETYQKALLLALGAVTSGAVQPIVAWVSDRYDNRSIGTLGFIVAIACIGNLGAANTFNQLLVLYCLGAMGIGAFHPIAASTVGHLAGSRRSLWIAYFFLAGMLGGIAGNIFTPRFVKMMSVQPDGTIDSAAGLDAIRWFIPVGLAFAVLLGIAIHKVGHRTHDAHATTVSWDRAERKARWFSVRVLYTANVFRFSVNMALVYLFSEWAEHYARVQSLGLGLGADQIGIEASRTNGYLQASMQTGMGAGGILLGIYLAARFEKLVFIVFPIVGSLAVAVIPLVERWAPGSTLQWTMFAAVFTGVGFGALIPVSITLAQKLLPHRTSLASGLMLGGAWMLSFVGPLAAEVIQRGLASKPHTPELVTRLVGILPTGIGEALMNGTGLEGAFYVTAVALFVSGCISFLLPNKLIVRCSR